MSLNSLSAEGESELWETIEDERNSSERPLDFNVDDVLSALTKTQKEYVTKHFKEGLSMSEIGKEKKVSRQAVSIAIKSAFSLIS